jgi:uncharacterized membrane-anchored protein
LVSLSTALIALGAFATLGAATSITRSAEQILRDGTVIYVALQPVDPRSLMQGDYMALAFDTRELPDPESVNDVALAVAMVNDKSVATIYALAPADAKLAPDQILLKLRAKQGRWFVGSDAFFFKEGSGDDYAAAKFGEFRVGADGRMLLAGLVDENLQSLPHP